MNFENMTFAHVIFIPSVLLIGILIGYSMGARAIRAEFARQRKRLEE